MMKKQIAILTLWLLPFGIYGQGISWVKHMGGEGTDDPTSICADTAGNIYVSGRFGFGAAYGIFGNDTVENPGLYSTFISKLDSHGGFLWTRRAGGTTQPVPGILDYNSICYDRYNNNLVVWSRLSSDNQTSGACPLNGYNSHLRSLDLNGNCLWSIGFPNVNSGRIISDGAGALYAILNTGNGSSTIGGESVVEGAYLVKLNASNGSVLWKRRITVRDVLFGIPVVMNGSLYVGGTSELTDWILDTMHIENSPWDVFIAKLDTSGEVQWVNTLGGEGFVVGGQLDVDSNGNIYTSGSYSGTAYFDEETFLVNEDEDQNFFAAKLNTYGELIWVVEAPTQGNLVSRFTKLDGSGNLLCGGTLTGSIDLNGQIVASEDELALVIRLDADGEHLNSLSFNVGYQTPISVASTETGLTYLLSGYNQETAIGHEIVPTFGGRDVLVARLDYTTGGPEARLINNELHIYANPSAGKCNITVPDEFLNEPQLTLRIMDMGGRLVSEQVLNMSSSKIGLNLEAEASGVYNISLSNGVKHYFGRAVFE